MNVSLAKPTEFRLNDIYVLLYSNIARILVQGIVPFISLSFLNYRIYWVMKRRREMKDRPRLGSGIDIEGTPHNRSRVNSTIANEVHLLSVLENPVCRASFSAEKLVLISISGLSPPIKGLSASSKFDSEA